MQKTKFSKLLPVLLAAGLFLTVSACAPVKVQQAGKDSAPGKAAVTTAENVYTGKVLGVSKKAKTISVKVGKKNLMVRFDTATKGMEYINKGHVAIINYEVRDGHKVATVIKPKLVKLPPGVTTIEPEEVAALVALGPEKGNYMLVDSRPASRYNQAHIPTAVSIPVPKLKKEIATILPTDKNKLIIFY